MPQRDACHSKFYSTSFSFSLLYLKYSFIIFFEVIMSQASERIIHGSLRPEDNDKE